MNRSGKFMAIAAALAALGAASVTAPPAAYADTCETFPGSQVYTDNCGANAQPSARPAAPVPPPAPSKLREQLRRSLQSTGGAAPSPAQSQAIDAAEQRWIDAQARAQDATYRAQQTDDPALKAQLKEQYDAAMRDLHQAGADLMAADPQQKATIQALLKRYDAQGAAAAAAAGFTPPPAAAAPAGPDNVTAIGDKTYVCDGTIAGANNVSCRQISADGRRCTNVTLADGNLGWQDSVSTPCDPGDLAQRKAFLAGNPGAAAAVANASPSFTVDPAATDQEVKRLSGRNLAGALDSVPPECRADFETFLGSGKAKSKANADQAAASYARLDARPECREAMARLAGVLGVGLPHRKVADDQRNDWNAALAGPQRASIDAVREVDVSNIPDNGFNPEDSLDSAIDMLSALQGGLGAMSGSTRTMPSYRPAPASRAPAPAAARGSSPPANYPAPAPSRGNNCTMDANNWLTCR